MKLFDMHCDTIYECYETGKHLRENHFAIDYQKVTGYGHYAQFFALFCGTQAPEEDDRVRALVDLPHSERLGALLETAKEELRRNADWLMLCLGHDDLHYAREKGKAAAFLSIEGAELLTHPQALAQAYDAGVRLITLVWNNDNQYVGSAAQGTQRGMTPAGFALVDEMLARRMIIDVSHMSQAGFWELCAYTEAPLVASHSNSNTICPHVRNLTDLQFQELLRRGGLVGINLFSDFLTQEKHATIDDVLRHIEHFCALGGESIVALGADFDGCQRLPIGIETARDMDQLANAMLQKNYLQSTVDGIFYDHLAAFMSRVG